ncbi:MAG: phosphate ABC transporter permease PstA [Candidatus Ranarchaeia archaeon]
MINKPILKNKNKSSKNRQLKDKLTNLFLGLTLLVMVIPFFLIIYDVIVKGLPAINLEFLLTIPRTYGTEGGILNAIVGSTLMVAIACCLAIPLSLGGAIFITEYSRKGKFRTVVETTSDILSGVPSIVFGAFGFTFFVWYLDLGISTLTGGLTLGLMMIPTVLRTTQEALLAVPKSIREASLALGATKLITTVKVTLRVAFPAVITGLLLAIGRVIGETAPLLFTAGDNRFIPRSIFDWGASLPFTIYKYIESPFLSLEGKAYGTALVLILIVFAVDIAANYVSRKVALKTVKRLRR